MKKIDICKRAIYTYDCKDKTKEQIKLQRQLILENECNFIEEFEKLWNQKEKKCEPGLHIGDFLVKKISGPVSMQVMNTTTKEEGIRLPLVILWGDNHRDLSNMCEPCDSKEDCYSVYDSTFLENLNQFASRYPVDFYMESDYLSFYRNTYPKDVLDYFRGGIYNCINKQIDDECPYKNIRWHSTDVRFMRNVESTIGFIENTKTHLDSCLTRIKTIIQHLVKTGILIKLDYLKPNFSNMSSDQLYGLNISIEMLAHTLKSNIGLIQAVQVYKRSCMEKKSSIMKQLRKIKNSTYNSLDFWMGIVTQCIFDVRYYSNIHKDIKELKNEIGDNLYDALYYLFLYICTGNDIYLPYISLDIKFLTENAVNRFFSLAKRLLLILTNHFVDLYTVLRMIKQPDGGEQPLLAMCYHGYNHSKGIAFMLKKVFKYNDIFFADNSENMNRCITIDTQIDVEKEIYYID